MRNDAPPRAPARRTGPTPPSGSRTGIGRGPYCGPAAAVKDASARPAHRRRGRRAGWLSKLIARSGGGVVAPRPMRRGAGAVPRLRAVVLGLALAACTTRPAVAAADAGWVAAAAHRGIAYFLRNAPAGVARYDMTARHWLSPVPVAAGATALAVGDPGLYVAFGRRISRFPLAGGPEQHLLNTAGPVRELLLAGPLVASVQASDGLLAIDSASGAILDETGTFYASYGLAGLSAAPTRWRIFGRDQGLSPPD